MEKVWFRIFSGSVSSHFLKATARDAPWGRERSRVETLRCPSACHTSEDGCAGTRAAEAGAVQGGHSRTEASPLHLEQGPVKEFLLPCS